MSLSEVYNVFLKSIIGAMREKMIRDFLFRKDIAKSLKGRKEM